MKITLMQGSPHKQGSSNILAEQFQAGASQNGHEVVVFDTAQAQVAPCLACEYCHTKGNRTGLEKSVRGRYSFRRGGCQHCSDLYHAAGR